MVSWDKSKKSWQMENKNTAGQNRSVGSLFSSDEFFPAEFRPVESPNRFFWIRKKFSHFTTFGSEFRSAPRKKLPYMERAPTAYGRVVGSRSCFAALFLPLTKKVPPLWPSPLPLAPGPCSSPTATFPVEEQDGVCTRQRASTER